MPLYRHGTTTTIAIATLPAIGLIGYLVMLWRTRRETDQLVRWASIGAMAALLAIDVGIDDGLAAAFAASALALPPRTSLSQSPASFLRLPRLGLVIGNSKYAEAPLRNPVNDATALAAGATDVIRSPVPSARTVARPSAARTSPSSTAKGPTALLMLPQFPR